MTAAQAVVPMVEAVEAALDQWEASTEAVLDQWEASTETALEVERRSAVTYLLKQVARNLVGGSGGRAMTLIQQ